MFMNKEDFGHILDNPAAITADRLEALRHERDQHPYCAPLQVLSLMADKLAGTPLWETQTLPRVALYTMDPRHMESQLNNLSTPTADPSAGKQPSQTSHVTAEPEGEFDILKETNAYQEVSFKTAPKSVILSNFLEKDGGISLDADASVEMSVQDLAKKSIQPTESLETETMAIMLARQGKIDPAVAIYRKLISKYPEKSSIFAARIAEAESLRKQ